MAVHNKLTGEDMLLTGLSITALSKVLGKTCNTLKFWMSTGIIPEPMFHGIEYVERRYYTIKEVAAMVTCLSKAETRYLKPGTPDAIKLHKAIEKARQRG